MSTNSSKPEPEDYNKTLQEELLRVQSDMKALQSEFNDLAETDDGTLTPDAARKALVASAPKAIQEIATLSTMADSEAVRLNASKYITDVTLGKIQIGDPADNAFKTFLETLKEKKDAKDAKDAKNAKKAT